MTVAAPTLPEGLSNGALQLPNEALEALFQRLSELSSLPSIALRIIEAAVDEGTDAEDLRRLIEKDPALSARIIRIVNSSFYAMRQEVADLKSAIAMLGTKQIRNIAITVFVSRQFRPAAGSETLDRTRLWNHAMAVGAISRLIANTTRKCDPEEAYLAGLLHDIGLLIIDQHLSRHVPKIQAIVDEGKSLHEATQQVLTFDPSQLGAYVAWRSHFPSRLVGAIEFHRRPEEYAGEDRALTDLVAVSDYIATKSGTGILEHSEAIPPAEAVFARLDLGDSAWEDIWAKVDDTLAATQSMAAF